MSRPSRQRPPRRAVGIQAFVAIAAVALLAVVGYRLIDVNRSGPRVASAEGARPAALAIENVDVAVEPPVEPPSANGNEGDGGMFLAPSQASPTIVAHRTAEKAREFAIPTPLLIPRSSAYSPHPITPDSELAEKIRQRVTGQSGHVGIAIEDLGSGRSVIIDPDTEYQAASLFKLSVMYEVFKQRDAGRLSFDETLTLTERHVSFDLGTLDRPAGSTIQLGEALERMITISDNSSAILLSDRVGAGTINQDLRGLGLQHTRLVADDLVTSPGDMLSFLEMLARGQGVDEEASAEMVQLMARQRINDRIPRLLPANVVVAHKTGNLPGVVNDVGIVYAPDTAFIVVVLVDGTDDEGKASLMTADLSQIAYQYFRQTPDLDVSFPTVGPVPTSRPRTPTAEPSPTDEPTLEATVAPAETRTIKAKPSNPPAVAPSVMPDSQQVAAPPITTSAPFNPFDVPPVVASPSGPSATTVVTSLRTPSLEPTALVEPRPDAGPQR